jgi:hypothetical protein
LALDPDTVRAPDASFVVAERAEAVGTEKYAPESASLTRAGSTFRPIL